MKSNLEWKKWGERDPLYAVSAWEGKERGSPNAWTDEEFYELGRSDWADFSKHWEQYGMNREHCVEIGCGAGRITRQLSGSFRRVTALDVSEHQLDYARTRLAANNIDFILTDGTTIPATERTFTAAFSAHVFQHFDSHDNALAVFREIHRVLIPGGSLMIHLPLYEWPRMPVAKAFRQVIRLIKRVGNLRADLHRRMLVKGKWRFVMRRLSYERRELTTSLQNIGFTNIEIRIFAVRSNNDYHPFVFATAGSLASEAR